ncbi:DUF3078 domain-containing protein [Carboxylicivirga mesophila]|uniref:DUF3078 domain-containing protein n=1 Tax=Carboxylicivirga mesophila TaxID=1166478 RepID=A0ABS5K934_9BACT|nr:DUF3078 domain-containing protein [Carboxylicivirga mesophila]MBS2211465.1 DUF3078 domain-containing protein [Carboxylicivirga mesophila]
MNDSQNNRYRMKGCIRIYLFHLFVFSLLGLGMQSMKGQISMVDWSYWANNERTAHWQKELYKYNTSRYPAFEQLFLAEYFKRQIDKEQLFDTNLFPPLRDYPVKTYKFSAKFKVPEYPVIAFKPHDYSKSAIEEFQELMNSKVFSNQSEEVFAKKYFIKEVHQDYIYSHLDQVGLSWDSIPDPPKIGRDGYLKRRSAREGISLLLRDNSVEAQPSLEKIKVTAGPWTFQGTENILFSQGYVENWVKGGESSISLGSDLRLTANYKEGKHDWDNYIIHKVGIISTETEKGRVNTDLIEINTKYGHKASEKWYYSFLYNFKTQLFYGYDKDNEDPVSGFMAPAYMSFAVGMDYKPNSNFTLLLSPITSRLTIVADTVKFNQTKFGVPKDKMSHLVNGLSVVNNLSYELSREIKLSSRLDAFYQYLGRREKGKDPQVQVDWEVIADLRINRFLSTRILAHLRYFTNESEKVQIRENFNINFSYNF